MVFVAVALSRVADLGAARTELNVLGLGGLFAALAIGMELVGGIILALGWKLRSTAGFLMGYLVALTAVLAPALTNPVGRATLISHVALIAALMMLRARGPGSRSLDHVLEARGDR